MSQGGKARAKRPLALVYRGPASCSGCSEAAAALLQISRWDFAIQYVGLQERLQLAEAAFEGATLYMQPGGNGTVEECIGYLDHPFKKDGLGLLDHAYPLTRNLKESQGEPVLLAGWREKDSIKQAHQIFWQPCSRKQSGCSVSSLCSDESGNTMTRWRTPTHS
jgi:hypothetical protein